MIDKTETAAGGLGGLLLQLAACIGKAQAISTSSEFSGIGSVPRLYKRVESLESCAVGAQPKTSWLRRFLRG